MEDKKKLELTFFSLCLAFQNWKRLSIILINLVFSLYFNIQGLPKKKSPQFFFVTEICWL